MRGPGRELQRRDPEAGEGPARTRRPRPSALVPRPSSFDRARRPWRRRLASLRKALENERSERPPEKHDRGERDEKRERVHHRDLPKWPPIALTSMIRAVPVFFAVQSTYHTWELDWLDKRDREIEPDEMSIVLDARSER
jgi:hypothetical protein